MPIIKSENIFKLFLTDTFMASTQGATLQQYMMRKHKWTAEDYADYQSRYMRYLTEVSRADLSKILPDE